MCRHGTRNPKFSTIHKILSLEKYQNLNKEKSSLNTAEFEDIKLWKYDVPLNKAGNLNDQGIEDMKNFGRKLRILYKDVFNEEYNDNNFTVIFISIYS